MGERLALRSRSLNERYFTLLTMRNESTTTSTSTGTPRWGSSVLSGGSGCAYTLAARMQAAAGVGSPTQNRRSYAVRRRLKRARRIAPQIMKRNDTVHPTRPNEERHHENIRTAGATPNETTSA